MGLLSFFEKSAEARRTQKALTEAFAQRGVNFMQVHPVVHKALLKEALMFKRTDRTVEMFFEILQTGYDNGFNDGNMAGYLIPIYEARMEMYSLENK